MYYHDTLKILNLPLSAKDISSSPKGIEDDEISQKIYDKLTQAYLHTNLEKAKSTLEVTSSLFGETFNVEHSKNLLSIIEEDYPKAEEGLSSLLDASPTPIQKSYVSNNLAMSKFYQFHDAKKAARGKVDEIPGPLLQKEHSILPLFKQSLKGFEDVSNRDEKEKHTLESLLDEQQLGPEEFYSEAGHGEYFKAVQNIESGKVITNICEHMLLQGLQIDK